MQTRIIDYDEQVHENERLRSYLGFRERFDHKLVVAEVIAKDPSSPFGSLRVDRGQLDGVRIGMPVVTADGLVGKVIRVGIKFADIQLATDSNFYLDILLQRTRVRGVLRGVSGNRCLLRLHRRAEIRIGDRIITSGIIGGFVKGLPVGKIVRISYDSDNVSQTVAVEPWVNFGKLEEVMILFSNDPEVEKISDTAGEEWLKSAMKDASIDRTSRE